MVKKSAADRTRVVPVRFPKGTRARLHARNEARKTSEWIREIILARATAVVTSKGRWTNPVKFDRRYGAIGYGDQICVRFAERDYEIVRKAAHIEKLLPTTWIRAVVLDELAA